MDEVPSVDEASSPITIEEILDNGRCVFTDPTRGLTACDAEKAMAIPMNVHQTCPKALPAKSPRFERASEEFRRQANAQVAAGREQYLRMLSEPAKTKNPDSAPT